MDLQSSDSVVVLLPSACGGVLGQVALAPSLINQSGTLRAVCMCFTCSDVCHRITNAFRATMLSYNFFAFGLSLITDRYEQAT